MGGGYSSDKHDVDVKSVNETLDLVATAMKRITKRVEEVACVEDSRLSHSQHGAIRTAVDKKKASIDASFRDIRKLLDKCRAAEDIPVEFEGESFVIPLSTVDNMKKQIAKEVGLILKRDVPIGDLAYLVEGVPLEDRGAPLNASLDTIVVVQSPSEAIEHPIEVVVGK
jgi:hypothetical protein